MNIIQIILDELIPYNLLPKDFVDTLEGYNAFKQIGIEFTNIKNNRQMCSPSRSCIFSGVINTGIQDNIDLQYQFETVDQLNPNFNTIAKILTNNNYETGYYGKFHLNNKLATQNQITPTFSTNTKNTLKGYGYKSFSSFGDPYYYSNEGIFGDSITMNLIMPPNSLEYDYEENDVKYSGAIPFLKARVNDKKKFYLTISLQNPHDTQHSWQNLDQVPYNSMYQFKIPFIDEQVEESNIPNPYDYNKYSKNEYIKHLNLLENYFEKTYQDYKIKFDKMPFKKSYKYDYCLNPTYNSIFPWFVGLYQNMIGGFTMPEDKKDLKNWKNLINIYYGLIKETDKYIFQIYNFLKVNNLLDNTIVIIHSDHGDNMSAHGLKQKGLHFNENVNIPLIISCNKFNPKLLNTKSNVLGSSIDINPTILSLLQIENQFMGSSLIKQLDEYFIVDNIDKPILNLTNSIMLSLTYVNYKVWIKNNPSKKLLYYPQNYFEYQSFFLMTVKKINNVTYKFCRYYSWYELFNYNYNNNKKLCNVIFSKNEFKCSIDNYLFKLDKSVVKSFLNKLPNKFSFNYGYNLFSKNDNTNLYLFMFVIFKLTSSNLKNIFILPGLYNNYDELKNNKNYSFFCYNLDKDKSEIYNLVEHKQNNKYNTIYNILNDEINNNIVKYKCKKFFFITPDNLIFNLLLVINNFKIKLSDYNSQQQLLYSSALLSANNDTQLSFDAMKLLYNYFYTYKNNL